MPTNSKSQKPIARVSGKVSAKIYRGRFRMAEHTRYLDMNALDRANKAVIEIGSVHAAGISVPVVAEVRKGMIVKMRPLHCTGCKPSGRKTISRLEYQKAAKAALQKVRGMGLHSLRLPVPVSRLRAGIFGITITIIDDYEWCIVIEFGDGSFCVFCTQTPPFCVSAPEP